ncbi:MPA2 family protein involved in capsular polysaccharide export [Bordetella ansorpii]|uniref:MPA2 family protein involved in capsular polysaccharide export n=2 Tax=Bordetella ansorpii TaxID=288768 RepID=A0A157M8T7_9BORD|nr:MPA2 family protein involved in capsular polysaccharide export [Bordetella ansorpii]
MVKILKKHGLFLGIVVVPMIVAIAYFVSLSMDRYVSRSTVVVRSLGGQGGSAAAAQQMQGLSMLLGAGNASSLEETLYVSTYVSSQDMLNILQSKLRWSEQYAGNWHDFWFYLPEDATQEDILKFYQRMVTTTFDETNGLLTIQVQSFDKEFAKRTLDTIVAESDRFVNELSHKLARDQVDFAQGELERARHNYEEKRTAMLDFQAVHNLLDAEQSAAARNEVIATLQSNLVTAHASLRAMKETLNKNSPQVQQQERTIRALENQIAVEEKKLVAASSSSQLNVIASKYRALEVDAGIAEASYKSTVNSLESARIEATKKMRSLSVIVSANEPDEALYPRRGYSLATTLIILLLIYGIARFAIATVRDHQD